MRWALDAFLQLRSKGREVTRKRRGKLWLFLIFDLKVFLYLKNSQESWTKFSMHHPVLLKTQLHGLFPQDKGSQNNF